MRINNSEKLRQLINNGKLFLMEAHDGISSKIVEEANFSAIWASGLTISASKGKRDNNELSYGEVINHISDMVDSVHIPILMDADTGYGDWNTARIFAERAYKAGIAGICIEDKLFPKKNSFLDNGVELLENEYVFASKIHAIKESCPDLVVVARTESFIVGLDLQSALNRAEIYQNAGADAILIHSKKSDGKEVIDFLKAWNSMPVSIPAVIVPTKYPTISYKDLFEAGASAIIWANHNLRACIQAMEEITKIIYDSKSIDGLRNYLVDVSEIFRLQRNEELEEAEKRFSIKKPTIKAIVLAAGKNGDFFRCGSKIMNKTILQWTLERLHNSGINQISAIVPLDSSKELLGRNSLLGSEFYYTYFFGGERTGTKEEILNLQSYLNEKNFVDKDIDEIVLTFGDIWISESIQNTINGVFLNKKDIAVLENKDGKFLGIVKFKNTNEFLKFIINYPSHYGWSLERFVDNYIFLCGMNKKSVIINDSDIIDVNNIKEIQ